MSDSASIPPFSHPATTEKLLTLLDDDLTGKRILDLGAGAGYFSKRLFETLEARGLDPAAIITPCDLDPGLFRFEKLECVQSDLSEGLPFDEAAFDAVVCMEVIEHLPNQLALWRELARVTSPGGKALITTPNVLTINARLRYLFSGTMPLFDIMPIAERDVVHTTGHIGPISLYYLYYFARLAGFREVRFHVDRIKKSAVLLSPLFYLAAQCITAAMNVRRRRTPYFEENAPAVAALNHWRTFVGRTIIIEAIR
ncbi:MAG: class I SAM-dependent methyltransferase [Planctomycetota bacterium]|nr:class I SAM-dependent methyltransferase [Planctomycetota bacterium]